MTRRPAVPSAPSAPNEMDKPWTRDLRSVLIAAVTAFVTYQVLDRWSSIKAWITHLFS